MEEMTQFSGKIVWTDKKNEYGIIQYGKDLVKFTYEGVSFFPKIDHYVTFDINGEGVAVNLKVKDKDEHGNSTSYKH